MIFYTCMHYFFCFCWPRFREIPSPSLPRSSLATRTVSFLLKGNKVSKSSSTRYKRSRCLEIISPSRSLSTQLITPLTFMVSVWVCVCACVCWVCVCVSVCVCGGCFCVCLCSKYKLLFCLSLSSCFPLETALRNVSMFFRSEPSWTIVNPLKDIGIKFTFLCYIIVESTTPTFTFAPPTLGWRIRKQYYLIQSKGDVKLPQHLLTWVSPW